MITPRTTRLLRTADLRAFHRAILSCIPVDPIDARSCAVIVASRGAGEEFRRTIEHLTLSPGAGGAARALPDLTTRDDFYERLRERIPEIPALLTPFDREVLLRRSARAAHVAGAEPPLDRKSVV